MPYANFLRQKHDPGPPAKVSRRWSASHPQTKSQRGTFDRLERSVGPKDAPCNRGNGKCLNAVFGAAVKFSVFQCRLTKLTS